MGHLKTVFVLLTLVILSLVSQGQMYQWQMDTFKDAEKARKWRSKQKRTKIYKPKQRKVSAYRRRKFTYGQPTTIRHKGVR